MTELIIANWKSHKSVAQAVDWIDAWESTMRGVARRNRSKAQFVIAAPFPLLAALSTRVTDIEATSLGAQDLSPFPAGSYTGAVSARNLDGLHVTHAILGHSERRRYFHETHQDVANKVEQALANDITPVVCIDDEYLEAQAAAIDADLLERCVVAYEPLEAIGSGEFQPVEDVVKVVDQVKAVFGSVPVLYGGSVDASNVESYLEVTDGVLVGGASLEVDTFTALMKIAVTAD